MRHLGLAIGLFVALDLAAFSISFTISRQVADAAVAINLAGRQRMLSQRITKAALVAANPTSGGEQRAQAREEAAQAYVLFRTTLNAFVEGGQTLGGAGQPVSLQPAPSGAIVLVAGIRELIRPWQAAPGLGPEMQRFAHFMVEHNLEILDAMNQLTSALEAQSVRDVIRLQIAQAVAFVLSIINFFTILSGLQRARRRVEAQAVLDHLTGVLNRAGIYRTLDAALATRARSGGTLGVMLFDLDNFKAINDTHGHAVGDAVLVEVARRVEVWKAREWRCGRLGGDEFVMICPGITAEALQKMSRELGQVLAGIPAGGMVASGSVGWAMAEGDCSADSLISEADMKMYVHKAERRSAKHLRSTVRSALDPG